jgi:hypothetical protein
LISWLTWFILDCAMSPQTAQILIRPAYADDYPALERLASLDSAEAVPPRPVLLAEVDGTLRAALSMRDGSGIADPFFPTLGLLTLLAAHADGDAASVSSRARRRRLRRRRVGRPRLVHG